jgi:hypothetical protein
MKRSISKIYFKNLLGILNKTHHLKLFYLPEIHAINSFNRDYDINRFQNFFNIKRLLDRDYFIFNKKKFKKTEVVLLTHYLGNKSLGKHDFYYGSIFKILKSQKINFTIIMLNKSTQSINEIKKNYLNFKYSTVIINNYSHPIKDFAIIIYTFFLYFRFLIYKNKIKFNLNEKKIIKKKINLKSFLKARTSIKIFKIIKAVIEKCENKIQNFITTYEGHAFEKMIFNYCQKKEITSIGYFFSVIRKDKSSILYPYPKNISPNKVFVTGKIVKNYFSKILGFSNKVIIVGSARSFIKKKFQLINFKNKKKIKVLFCPEGTYPESVIMYNLAIRLSLISKDIQPIIRFHPELDQKKLFKDKNILKNFYDNVKISDNTVDYDILESNFLIYRGSSTCVNAVFAGVFPIYFKLKDENSIDPLFEINNYIARSPQQLFSIIKKVKHPNNAKNINKYMSRLFSYSSNYFEGLNKKKLLKNINAI